MISTMMYGVTLMIAAVQMKVGHIMNVFCRMNALLAEHKRRRQVYGLG